MIRRRSLRPGRASQTPHRSQRVRTAIGLLEAICVSIAAVFLTLLFPLAIQAHDLLVPKADHLRISPRRIRLELRYDLSSGRPSEELRTLYDRDRNRQLDPEERAALQAYLELAATHFLRLTVDGVALPLTVRDRRVFPLDPTLPSARAIQSTFALEAVLPAWPAGDQRPRVLVLKDRYKDAAVPLPVSVGPEDGVRLIEATVVGPDRRRVVPLPAPGQPVLTGIRLRSGERLELRVARPAAP